MSERGGYTPDDADGFMCENGDFVEYPDPLNGTYDTPEGLEACKRAAYEVVDNPDVYGERLAGLNQHYIDFYNRQEGKGRGRWKRAK